MPVNLSWVEVGGQRLWTALFEQHHTVPDWDVVTAPAGGSAYQTHYDANLTAGGLTRAVAGGVYGSNQGGDAAAARGTAASSVPAGDAALVGWP